MDYTVSRYRELMNCLAGAGYRSIPVEYIQGCNEPGCVVLRHDVDNSPGNSLITAKIEKEFDFRGIYYFRVVKESWDEEIIAQIAGLGHEIGYHYEDMSLVASGSEQGAWGRGKIVSERQIVDRAIESFERNLERLRELVPVKSICMHGSPLSRWDSRLLWKYYDYKDFGIEFEPYFDLSFEDRLYLTDTGRRWNGGSVSVRDRAYGIRRMAYGVEYANPYAEWKRKPVPGSLMNMTPEAAEFQKRYSFRHTKDIIKAFEESGFPGQAMFTFHPQRWTDRLVPWMAELACQRVKNSIKYFLVRLRGGSIS